MGQPVVHFEVQGQDREALARFYAQLFDWKTNDISDMNYTLVETGDGGGINGGIGATPEGAPGGATFYVQSDNVAESLGRAEELGGKRVAGPMDMPDGHKWAMFADPEGHVIGLYGEGESRATIESARRTGKYCHSERVDVQADGDRDGTVRGFEQGPVAVDQERVQALTRPGWDVHPRAGID